MINKMNEFIERHRALIFSLFRHFVRLDKTLMLHSDIWYEFKQFVKTEAGKGLQDSAVEKFVFNTQVAAFDSPWVYLFVRDGIANSKYYKFHLDEVCISEVSVSDYLQFEERLINSQNDINPWTLEIDLTPFNRGFPRMKETKSAEGSNF